MADAAPVVPAPAAAVAAAKSSADVSAADAAAPAAAPAPTPAPASSVDNVERLQTLVTQHVELFERLLFVERDADEMAKHNRGDRSRGELYRHPSDMREDMPSDWHRGAIERAISASHETGTRSGGGGGSSSSSSSSSSNRNRVKIESQWSNCTIVTGDTAALHQMTDALSRNIFKELLDNRDAALATLSEVAFVVRDELASRSNWKTERGFAVARRHLALSCDAGSCVVAGVGGGAAASGDPLFRLPAFIRSGHL
jgi:hypothetical protein